MNILFPHSFLIMNVDFMWSFEAYVIELVAMLVISAYLFYGFWKKRIVMEREPAWQDCIYSKVWIAGQDYAHFDIYRLKDGKIVEHWDNKEVMPEKKDLTNLGKF